MATRKTVRTRNGERKRRTTKRRRRHPPLWPRPPAALLVPRDSLCRCRCGYRDTRHCEDGGKREAIIEYILEYN
jgi:hypothetical protein